MLHIIQVYLKIGFSARGANLYDGYTQLPEQIDAPTAAPPKHINSCVWYLTVRTGKVNVYIVGGDYA